MKLLTDVGVSYQVVNWLRSNGHSVYHLPEENKHHLKDSEIFTIAIKEERVIVTFDLDFGDILSFTQNETASTILFRLHNTRNSFVIDRLYTILNNCQKEICDGSMILVEDYRYRIRKLPI